MMMTQLRAENRTKNTSTPGNATRWISLTQKHEWKRCRQHVSKNGFK